MLDAVDSFHKNIFYNKYNFHPTINISDSFIWASVIIFVIMIIAGLIIYYFKISADLQRKDDTTKIGFIK